MDILSLTPRENELRDKLTKVGERILWYFRTRESERTYLSLTHGRVSKSWWWLNLCAKNAAKFTISYEDNKYTHDRLFKIKYNDDVILSGKVFVSASSMALYWNNWWMFVTIDLNKNTGECTNLINYEPKYPDLVTQKDLLTILNIVSHELDIAIVTAVQKKPEEELKENELHDKLNKVSEMILQYFRTREYERLYMTKDHKLYGTTWILSDLDNEVTTKIIISHEGITYANDPNEQIFKIKYNDDVILSGKVILSTGEMRLFWNNWQMFVTIDLNKNTGECTNYFNNEPRYPGLVDQKDLIKILNLISTNLDIAIVTSVQKKPEEPEELKKIAEEHDKEVLSDFCNTLKEFSEEYADSWLINKFNKLIGVLKTYCFELNQVDRYKKSTVRISYDWSYMFNRNLLPPVTMSGDRYHYDYNPTTFKIFDMHNINGDLTVKVDHETFEINFYFYHSATEPFLTISANDYMGHVKHSYYDSHFHMDEFRFKYLIELIEKELKIQIMNPFADPVIVDHTWKNPDPSIFKIKGHTVDLFNTTTFKGVKAMDLKTLRTIVLSWMSQYTTDDEMATISITHPTDGIRYRITMKDYHFNERSIYIQDDPKNNTFTIHNGGYGFPFTVITISGSDDISVEFNDKAYFKTFNKTELLMLFNMICIELGKESNADSAFTPPSVANIVNRYGNMSISPRYEVKDAFEMADGSKVITGLNLLSMNITKPRRNKDFSGAFVVPGCSRIIPRIKSILFNEKKKVTTIIWNDNTKTMAKCTADDDYDEEIGVAICIAKKYYDNNQNQMRKEINKFKTRQKKHETAVQQRLDKKNKSTEFIDNKPNEVKVDDNTDNIIG